MIRNIKAFSLIELMLVVIIISVISYVAMTNYLVSIEESKIRIAENELKTIKEGFLKYYTSHGGFPDKYPLKTLMIDGIIDNKSNEGSETYQMLDPWGNPYIFRYLSQDVTAPVWDELPFASTGALINKHDYYNIKCEIGCISAEFQGLVGEIENIDWIKVGEGRLEQY